MNQILKSKTKTIKQLEENIISMLFDINRFLNLSPHARATKAKINKWDDIKLKICWHNKGNYQQNEKATY